MPHKITKEHLFRALDSLNSFHVERDKFAAVMGEFLDGNFVASIGCGIIEAVVKLLDDLCSPEERTINYFLYDMPKGDGLVRWKCGREFPIRNREELWEYLEAAAERDARERL